MGIEIRPADITEDLLAGFPRAVTRLDLRGAP